MFTGFSSETIDFLWGIRLNNNRTWFEEHKKDYQKYLYEPMKALAAEVFSHFQDVPNMAYKCSRIYKDARLHPAVPYKESLWLSMRPDNLPWSEQPTLYFEIRPEGYSYGFILWKPRAEMMEKFRQMLLAKPDEFPGLVKKLEKTSGVSCKPESYYRKKPCPDERVKDWYNLKTIFMDVDREPDELLFSPKLAQEVTKTLKDLYPLYEYCLKFTSSL